jgi:hypothetical protein
MPMPTVTEADKPAIYELTALLLHIANQVDALPGVALNALLGAYTNFAVEAGFGTDVPAALRSAADVLEQNMPRLLGETATH